METKRNNSETYMFRCNSGRDFAFILVMPICMCLIGFYELFSHSVQGGVILILLSCLLCFILFSMAVKEIVFYEDYFEIIKFFSRPNRFEYGRIVILKNIVRAAWCSSNNIIIQYNDRNLIKTVAFTASATSSKVHLIPDLRSFMELTNMLKDKGIKVMFDGQFQNLISKQNEIKPKHGTF